MRKLSLLTFFISLSTLASPLSQMNHRINNYQQMMAPDHCAAAASGLDFSTDDYGLMTSVECEITCKGQTPKRQRASGSFIPSSYGLYPGDGSSQNNTLWRSLAVTMKVWSEEVCLGEASEVCKGLPNIEDSVVKEIESGEWKLNRTLGCNEKEVTLSPFDQTVKSKRLPAPFAKQAEIVNMSHSLSILDQTYKLAKQNVKGECKHKMDVSLCFGDCIHDLGKGVWKETLATPEPLGRAEDTWCMDGIVETIKNQKNLSPQVKVKICEAYFWSNMMHSHGSGSSCAAIRGEHQCAKFVEGL